MRINTIIVFSLLIITTLLGTGCADLQGAIAQTGAWRDEAVVIRDDLEDRISSLHTQHALLDPLTPEAQSLDAQIRLARAKHSALDAAIAQAERVLAEAEHPTDALTQIAHGVSAWVPAPAQGPIVLGAALIATLVRSRQLKHSSMSIINSISHVLERDDQFRSIFEQHSDTIRSIQTPFARRLVDQTSRKRAGAS